MLSGLKSPLRQPRNGVAPAKPRQTPPNPAKPKPQNPIRNAPSPILGLVRFAGAVCAAEALLGCQQGYACEIDVNLETLKLLAKPK